MAKRKVNFGLAHPKPFAFHLPERATSVRRSSNAANSLQNFAEKAAVHGDLASIQAARRAAVALSLGKTPAESAKLLKSASYSVPGNLKAEATKLRRSLMQSRGVKGWEGRFLLERLREIEEATSQALLGQNASFTEAAQAFGIPSEKARVKTPPFIAVNAYKVPSGPIIGFHPWNREFFLHFTPTDHLLGKRVLQQDKLEDPHGIAAKLRGVGYGTLSLLEMKGGERVLLVDNIQKLPSTSGLKQSHFPEFKNFQEVLFLRALEFARENGIKRVVVPDKEFMLKRWGHMTNSKTAKWPQIYERLGAKFQGKKVTIRGEYPTVTGFGYQPSEWGTITGYEWRLREEKKRPLERLKSLARRTLRGS